MNKDVSFEQLGLSSGRERKKRADRIGKDSGVNSILKKKFVPVLL